MNPRKLARLLGLALLALGIAWSLAHRELINGPSIQAWLGGLGPWAAPAYVLAYAIGALLFFPGSILSLAGGAVFGPLLGIALTLLGATLGATLAFLVARVTSGAWVTRRLGGRMAKLVQGVEQDGWRFVAFVRLVPLFPYNLLNYGLGLTRISLSHYVLATALCMIPGAAAYSYLGYAGRQALTGPALGTQPTMQPAIQAAGVGLALLGTAIFVIPRLARRWRSRPR